MARNRLIAHKRGNQDGSRVGHRALHHPAGLGVVRQDVGGAIRDRDGLHPVSRPCRPKLRQDMGEKRHGGRVGIDTRHGNPTDFHADRGGAGGFAGDQPAIRRPDLHRALRLLVNSTVQDVKEKEKTGYDEVEGTVEGQFGQGVDWSSFSSLPTLEIDDLALKKGHRDFATVVSVRTEDGKNRLLGILENREKATVKAFFLSMPKHLRDTVQSVCSDL